ncbi:fructose-2,6-bisphosphatase TIGAR B [Gouania willdenowi]|nr:fructose-2,6-bisphosphatase TIGAR B-like [Gouania willdenowi]
MLTFSVTLVRHGETQYNRDKLLQGQGVDTLLSPTGVDQCEAVGRRLSDVPFSHVFVSNLQRAVQTAEIILRNNAHCSHMDMALEPLLRERGFGVAEGRPKEDLKNMANAAGQACRDYTPPGGETLDQVRLRFKQFLRVLFQQMLDSHDASKLDDSSSATGSPDDGLHGASIHVLVVSHGAYIRVAVRHLVEDLKCTLPAGLKPSQLFSPCPNTGISRFVLTVSRSGPESRATLTAARCVFTNRKEHLEELAEKEV